MIIKYSESVRTLESLTEKTSETIPVFAALCSRCAGKLYWKWGTVSKEMRRNCQVHAVSCFRFAWNSDPSCVLNANSLALCYAQLSSV